MYVRFISFKMFTMDMEPVANCTSHQEETLISNLDLYRRTSFKIFLIWFTQYNHQLFPLRLPIYGLPKYVYVLSCYKIKGIGKLRTLSGLQVN